MQVKELSYISLSGASKMQIKGRLGEISADISGAGNVEIDGDVQNLKFEISHSFNNNHYICTACNDGKLIIC